MRFIDFWFSEAHLQQECAGWMLKHMTQRWYEGIRWALLPVNILLNFPKLRKLKVTLEQLTTQLETRASNDATRIRLVCVRGAAHYVGKPVEHMPTAYQPKEV